MVRKNNTPSSGLQERADGTILDSSLVLDALSAVLAAAGLRVTKADGADVTLGATTDDAVAAGAAGSVSAKLRRLTTDLSDSKGLLDDVKGLLQDLEARTLTPTQYALRDEGTYSPLIVDVGSSVLAVAGGPATRIVFVKTPATRNLYLTDCRITTDVGVMSISFYRDVRLPITYTGEITVTAGCAVAGNVTVTVDGHEFVVAVNALDTPDAVATAIAGAIDAHADLVANAVGPVVSVSRAAVDYAPMTIVIDPAATGVVATVAMTADDSALTALSVINRNHASAGVTTTEVNVVDATVLIANCLTAESDLAETVSVLNSAASLTGEYVLKPDTVYALLIDNQAVGAANVVAHVQWYEEDV
jgi:hypothetical protein